MGGTQKPDKPIKIATGIEIRPAKNSCSIRIIFWYKGIECRETLQLEPTPRNIKYAERLRGEILNAIEHETFSYANYFPDSKRARLFGHVATNITIGELLTTFLKQAKTTLQPSTVRGYNEVSKAHLFPVFGEVPIQQLKPSSIRQWLAALNLTAKRVRNILTPLRAVFDEAINDDIIERNPLDRVKLNKVLNRKTSKSKYIVDPFTTSEIEAILTTATAQLHNLFQFAFFTGLRTSELIALEWNDIDWVNHILYVTRAFVEKQEKGTKTEAGMREVLLLPPALAALQAQKAYTYLEGKRVFHNPYMNSPWKMDAQIRNAWTPVLKRAGVRYRNPYQTRHTYASMMLSAGENMLWVAKQMGHRDTEMIIKHYAKWIPDTSTKVGYKPINDWSKTIKTVPNNYIY